MTTSRIPSCTQKFFKLGVPALCLLTTIAYTFDAWMRAHSTACILPIPAWVMQYVCSVLLPVLAAATSAAWFAFAFTGDPSEHRKDQVQFAYFFVIVSFAVLVVPPLVTNVAIGGEPIGIISGCVEGAGAEELRCPTSQTTPNETANQDGSPPPPPAAAAGTNSVLRNQWLVNIGGTLAAQGECLGQTNCGIGSPNNRAVVRGGVVVPLPLVFIALFGGAISLSRRVPEIQKRSEDHFVGTEAEPRLEKYEAREQLAFQILQFVSAPLIAIAAHQIMEPESLASAVALAFLAGFGSETILLMIRGVTNGLQPKSIRARNLVPEKADDAVITATATAAADAQADTSVTVRLAIGGVAPDAGTLKLTVDDKPVSLIGEGLAEVSLEVGYKHTLVATALRVGRQVRGVLELTPSLDDEGQAFEIQME